MTSHEAWLTQGITLWLGYFLLIGGIAALVQGNWALGAALLVGSGALMVTAIRRVPGCITRGSPGEPIRNPSDGLHP
jgi:hypothetical protein